MTSRAGRIALIQFPGSNCDFDCIDIFSRHFDLKLTLVWHTARTLPPVDAVIIPGGFSYGDYVRGGVLASKSPIMNEVRTFLHKGGAAIGICNGFQVLTETQLLPGALLPNESRRFACKFVRLDVAPGSSVYQKVLDAKTLSVPIAHGEGRYFIDEDGLRRLQDGGQIVFRYQGTNPNGSVDSIAGICSENGRVLGMMPHPERACDPLMGGSRDGLAIWEAFLASFT